MRLITNKNQLIYLQFHLHYSSCLPVLRKYKSLLIQTKKIVEYLSKIALEKETEASNCVIRENINKNEESLEKNQNKERDFARRVVLIKSDVLNVCSLITRDMLSIIIPFR